MALEEDIADPLSDLAGLLANDRGDQQPGDDASEPEQSAASSEGDPAPVDGTSQEPQEGDAEPEGEGTEEPSTEPFYTVKIDGKDERVTLKEALAGYQRHADYSRKTEEVAAARKAAEAEAAIARAQRDEYAAGLRQVQARLATAYQEPTVEQWNALRERDPASYATAYADYQRLQDQRRADAAEQFRLFEENRQHQTEQARTFLESERQKLVAAIPVFGDREKAHTEMKALREYAAKTFGYSEQEMDQAYDHRMILAIDKARRWDAHQQALARARGKVESAPALPPPGPRVTGSAKQTARATLQKRLEQTGDPDDAAALLIM